MASARMLLATIFLSLCCLAECGLFGNGLLSIPSGFAGAKQKPKPATSKPRDDAAVVNNFLNSQVQVPWKLPLAATSGSKVQTSTEQSTQQTTTPPPPTTTTPEPTTTQKSTQPPTTTEPLTTMKITQPPKTTTELPTTTVKTTQPPTTTEPPTTTLKITQPPTTTTELPTTTVKITQPPTTTAEPTTTTASTTPPSTTTTTTEPTTTTVSTTQPSTTTTTTEPTTTTVSTTQQSTTTTTTEPTTTTVSTTQPSTTTTMTELPATVKNTLPPTTTSAITEPPTTVKSTSPPTATPTTTEPPTTVKTTHPSATMTPTTARTDQISTLTITSASPTTATKLTTQTVMREEQTSTLESTQHPLTAPSPSEQMSTTKSTLQSGSPIAAIAGGVEITTIKSVPQPGTSPVGVTSTISSPQGTTRASDEPSSSDESEEPSIPLPSDKTTAPTTTVRNPGTKIPSNNNLIKNPASFSTSSSTPPHGRPTITELKAYTRKIVDRIIRSFAKMIIAENLQPYPISDSKKGFSKEIFEVRLSGEASLYDGSIISGLDSISRTGHVDFVTIKNKTHSGRRLIFDLEFDDPILVMSEYKLKLFELGPEGRISASYEDLEFNVEASVTVADNNAETPGIFVELEKVTIKDFGSPQLHITGAGALEIPAKVVTKLIFKFCKKAMLQKIEDVVTELLNMAIARTISTLPIGMVLPKII